MAPPKGAVASVDERKKVEHLMGVSPSETEFDTVLATLRDFKGDVDQAASRLLEDSALRVCATPRLKEGPRKLQPGALTPSQARSRR